MFGHIAGMIHKTKIAPKMTNHDARQLREYLEWSQEEMGNFLGVSRETVSRRESGLFPITREYELALRFVLISEQGLYSFPWRRK